MTHQIKGIKYEGLIITTICECGFETEPCSNEPEARNLLTMHIETMHIEESSK